MSGKIVLGAQWGDEGKGKYIDIFSSQADMVVRSQGGNNAGHTVVADGKVYKLHLIPSGILYPNCDNLIGAGVVIDPVAFFREVDELESQGVSTRRLFVDPRAHVVMPWHITIDGLSETSRGKNDIGTTRKGIGPCYMTKVERSGIRVHDFVNPETFETVVRTVGARQNGLISRFYDGQPLNLDEIVETYRPISERLRNYVADTSVLAYKALKANKNVLFEGAQGTLLDIDMGTYPYVTSSHPVAGGVCVGLGIGPTFIDESIGIAKAYTTRVGKGPFPTELMEETGEYIRERGAEYGVTTGRARRTGWLDTVILRYAVRVNGHTSLVLNKIDPLAGLPVIKVCVAYRLGDKLITDFPADLATLSKCEPVYEEFEGFDEDITGCTSFEELPAAVRKYIERVEELCECRISYIGVGPDRTQIIAR